MSYQSQGSSNRQMYDCCKYNQTLEQSVNPLQYQLYLGAYENSSKCIDKKAWYKFDKEVVDIESDLWNIVRPLSDCDNYQYNPECKNVENCVSTFDSNAPIILSPSLCPIVYNNIPVQTDPGYSLPNTTMRDDMFTNLDSVNTYKQYKDNADSIMGKEYKFLNACNQQPYYSGVVSNVNAYDYNL
jgi:hypothetical protein